MPLPDGMQIRRLAASDSISELTALLHRAYAPLGEMGLRYLATYQDDEVTTQRCASGEAYVVEAEGAIVGTVLFRSASQAGGCDWYDRADVAYLGQFAVDPGHQGVGIGSALLDFVENRARETGAAELALDTAAPARHLIEYYGHRGYRLVETVQWESANYRSVILSKTL